MFHFIFYYLPKTTIIFSITLKESHCMRTPNVSLAIVLLFKHFSVLLHNKFMFCFLVNYLNRLLYNTCQYRHKTRFPCAMDTPFNDIFLFSLCHG